MLSAFLVAALCALALAGTSIGAAAVARHRAQSAADLAALAAAAHLAGGPAGACRTADLVAAYAGGVLQRCDVDDLDVVVMVAVAIDGPLRRQSRAVARAGPV